MKNKSNKNKSNKKRNSTKSKYTKYKNINRKTKRLHLLRRKYRCVKGGAPTTTVAPNVSLPIVIDKNNITYTCSPIPTS